MLFCIFHVFFSNFDFPRGGKCPPLPPPCGRPWLNLHHYNGLSMSYIQWKFHATLTSIKEVMKLWTTKMSRKHWKTVTSLPMFSSKTKGPKWVANYNIQIAITSLILNLEQRYFIILKGLFKLFPLIAIAIVLFQVENFCHIPTISTLSRILPINLLITMHQYISGFDQFALAPLGIAIIDDSKNELGAYPWLIIELNNCDKYIYNIGVPWI